MRLVQQQRERVTRKRNHKSGAEIIVFRPKYKKLSIFSKKNEFVRQFYDDEPPTNVLAGSHTSFSQKRCLYRKRSSIPIAETIS